MNQYASSMRQQPSSMNQSNQSSLINSSRFGGGSRQSRQSRQHNNADPLGNIIILPKQLEVGLCSGCHNIFGGQHQNGHHHQPHQQQVCQLQTCEPQSGLL